MIVEQDRVKEEKEKMEKEKRFLKYVAAKADVYERLMSNKDYLESRQDIRDRISAHQRNVESYTSILGVPNDDESVEHPLLRKLRLTELIAYHQIQKSLCEEFINMPERVKASKQEAIEKLNEIEKLEKETNNAA